MEKEEGEEEKGGESACKPTERRRGEMESDAERKYRQGVQSYYRLFCIKGQSGEGRE